MMNYRKNCSMKKITVLALLLACSTASWAGDKNSAWNKYLHGYEYQARVAYNLGGTAPIGMPATPFALTSVWAWMPITHSPETGVSWAESASRTRA